MEKNKEESREDEAGGIEECREEGEMKDRGRRELRRGGERRGKWW